MSLLKSLILALILLTTYIVESAFNDPESNTLFPTLKKVQPLHSIYVDKEVNIGGYKLGINEKSELIYISKGSQHYDVYLESPINLNSIVSNGSIVGKRLSDSLAITINSNIISIDSTIGFDFSILETNTGQSSPFFTSEDGVNSIDVSGETLTSSGLVLEREARKNIVFLRTDKAKYIKYKLSPRHHSVVVYNSRHLEFSVGDAQSIALFDAAKKSNDFIITRAAESILTSLVNSLNSKLASIIVFLLFISIISLPLEKFILEQNNRLNTVKPLIDKIKTQLLPSQEQTKQIQLLYKEYGVKALLTPVAFSFRILLMILSIITLLNATAIEGMSFVFIGDFNQAGDGWLLVWILPILYLTESKLKGALSFDNAMKTQIGFYLVYVALSLFLLTPLIVLVIIYFTVMRLLALLLEKINSTSKEKLYVANISK